MANDNTINGLKGATVDPSALTSTENKTAKTTSSGSTIDGMSQQEFLMLLVNQLQNQDPLNPMDSQEFAVQLAQFAQVEQLIGINQKLEGGLGEGGGNAVRTMASYLGHEVVLANQNAVVSGGMGPNVLLDVPAGTQSARIDLIDSAGATVASQQLDEVAPGKQQIQIASASIPNGEYTLRAVAVNSAGVFEELETRVTGTVEGFVLEPEPALLVNGEQVMLEDVREVYARQESEAS